LAVSDVDSDSNSKSKSGEFTFGKVLEHWQWINIHGYLVISDILSEHRRANNHLKGRNGRKTWAKEVGTRHHWPEDSKALSDMLIIIL
jgi:hypothetical protein